jgi:hypothetical protein
MSQQGLRHAALRASTGTTWTYEGDWLARFNALGTPAGTYNERMLSYINTKLGTSYTEINGAMRALAENQSGKEFQGLGTFTV